MRISVRSLRSFLYAREGAYNCLGSIVAFIGRVFLGSTHEILENGGGRDNSRSENITHASLRDSDSSANDNSPNASNGQAIKSS